MKFQTRFRADAAVVTMDKSYAAQFPRGHAEVMNGRGIGGVGKEYAGWFSGYVKPANLEEERRDRRLAMNQTRKRKPVIIIRERGGNSVPTISHSKSAALSFVKPESPMGTHTTYRSTSCVTASQTYSDA